MTVKELRDRLKGVSGKRKVCLLVKLKPTQQKAKLVNFDVELNAPIRKDCFVRLVTLP